MNVNCIRKKSGFPGILVIVSLVLTAACGISGGNTSGPAASQGLLDLSGWNKSQQETVEITGDWELYRNKLYTPADFAAQDGDDQHPVSGPEHPVYAPVTDPLPVPGYATYRLRLTGLEPGRLLGLKIGYVSNAYTLWAGNTIVAQAGVPGISEDTAIPAGRMCRNISFVPAAEEIGLVLQLSSFHCTESLVKNNIVLGSAEAINNLNHRELSLGFLYLGCLGIMFLFHTLSFLFSGRKRTDLFFAFFVLFFSVQLFFNEITLSSYFPVINLGYAWSVKLIMLSTAFAFLSFFLYADSLMKSMPRPFPSILKYTVTAGTGIFAVLSLSLRLETAIHITFLYETFVVSIGMIIILIMLFLNRKSPAVPILESGFTLFLVLSVTDISLQNFFNVNPNLLSAGIILFFFFNYFYERAAGRSAGAPVSAG